jgi:hypothetical protein
LACERRQAKLKTFLQQKRSWSKTAAARHAGHFGKRAGADEHELRLAARSAAPGSEVIVPVEVNAEGSETRFSFSLEFRSGSVAYSHA